MAMIVRHADVVGNENYGRSINQILTWHVKPTLADGKSYYEMENFRAVLVEMFDDGRSPVIKLNGDFKMSIEFKSPKINPSDVGKNISMDLKEIKEISWIDAETDGNSGKILIVRFNKDYWLLNFDFRYNKKDAKKKAERAKEFLSVCQTIMRKREFCSNVLVYLIWSCAELILDTKLFLFAQKPKPTHGDRLKKLNIWKKSFFSQEFADLFAEISEIKNEARYVHDGSLRYSKIKGQKAVKILKKEIASITF